jgi:CBS-domain-containing membrane protein
MFSGILHRRDQAKARGITAGDLMTAAVVAVRPEDTVQHAARLMYDRRVKRLPVTDANGHLAGIVSRADVLSVFDRTDEAIRKEINDDVLIGGLLVDPRSLEITVKDGIVTLAGRPETNDVGHDIIQRVRHLQGVVAVRDRFDYPPAERPGDTFDVLARFPMD